MKIVTQSARNRLLARLRHCNRIDFDCCWRQHVPWTGWRTNMDQPWRTKCSNEAFQYMENIQNGWFLLGKIQLKYTKMDDLDWFGGTNLPQTFWLYDTVWVGRWPPKQKLRRSPPNASGCRVQVERSRHRNFGIILGIVDVMFRSFPTAVWRWVMSASRVHDLFLIATCVSSPVRLIQPLKRHPETKRSSLAMTFAIPEERIDGTRQPDGRNYWLMKRWMFSLEPADIGWQASGDEITFCSLNYGIPSHNHVKHPPRNHGVGKDFHIIGTI